MFSSHTVDETNVGQPEEMKPITKYLDDPPTEAEAEAVDCDAEVRERIPWARRFPLPIRHKEVTFTLQDMMC